MATELRQIGLTQGKNGTESASKRKRKKQFSCGQQVQHERFGAGVITEIIGEGDEATMSILFDGEQTRTFLTSLVQDKLAVTK
ncbi:hypothetical protein KFU94_18855 [Chloroflexi bacterium TSY]|nr:hypothetical protein [Chloroflexi bacterium TSY]